MGFHVYFLTRFYFNKTFRRNAETNMRTWWEHVAKKIINRQTNKKNLIINNAIFHLWVMVETNRQKASKTSISFLALFLTTSLGHLPVSIQLFSSYFNIKRKLFNSPRVFIIRYPARKTRYGLMIENFLFKIYNAGITTHYTLKQLWYGQWF